MKKVIFIAAALCVLAACNKEVINSPEEGYGILKLSVESDDRVVVNTKADPVYDVNTDEFNVTIINDEGVTKKSGKPSEVAVVVLPADDYVIKAENISEEAALSNNGGKGQLRMAGATEKFTLSQSETEVQTVSCNPTNSKFTVIFDDTFKAAFNTMTVDLNQTTGDRDFSNIAETVEYFYNITEGAAVDVELTAVSKSDVHVTNTQHITLAVGYHYAVTYSATIDGQLNVSVRASDDLTQSDIPVPVNPYQPAA